MDAVPNTETSATSAKKCRLLCDPSKLPTPRLEQPHVQRLEEMDRVKAAELKDYYMNRIHKCNKARMKGVRKHL